MQCLVFVVVIIAATILQSNGNNETTIGPCFTTTLKDDVVFGTGEKTTGPECKIPFIYKGKRYNGCTLEDSSNKRPWCSLSVDEKGEHIGGRWGDCVSSCPNDFNGVDISPNVIPIPAKADDVDIRTNNIPMPEKEEYVGYQKLADQSCYQQIKGPHSDLNSAFNECNTMGRECKGVQYVNCSGIAKITKSLFEEQCKTKAAINTFTSIVNNPDCTILLYAKTSGIYSVTLSRSKGQQFGVDVEFDGPGFLYVTGIMAGSPAETSNEIHVGDRILAVNENNITKTDDISSIANMLKPDDTSVTFTISHQSDTNTTSTTKTLTTSAPMTAPTAIPTTNRTNSLNNNSPTTNSTTTPTTTTIPPIPTTARTTKPISLSTTNTTNSTKITISNTTTTLGDTTFSPSPITATTATPISALITVPR